MRLLANSSIAISFFILITFAPGATFDDGKAPPCKCSCGGQHSCPEGSSAYCECNDNKCSGECIPQQRDANKLAAIVISKITDQEVGTEDLQMKSSEYAKILEKLFDGKSEGRRYTFKYDNHEFGIGLTKEAAAQLKIAKEDLEARPPHPESDPVLRQLPFPGAISTPTSPISLPTPIRAPAFPGVTPPPE